MPSDVELKELQLSLRACHLARVAYDGMPSLDGLHVAHTLHEAETSTEGFIGFDDAIRCIVVAFRGTQQPEDWLTDVKFGETRPGWPTAGRCSVHAGFLEAAVSVRSQVEAAIKNLLKQENTKVLVVGHSLGGALGRITAPGIPALGATSVAIRTFGEPRSGDASWARIAGQLVSDSVRWVHASDLVPRVPSPALGFAHVGPSQVINDAGKIEQVDNLGLEFITGKTIQDHAIEKYEAAMMAACAGVA